MKAIQVIKSSQDSWLTQVALNYTQLNFDYSILSRIDAPDFDFYICDRFKKLENYEYIVVVPCGYILNYSFFERAIAKQITGEYEYYYFPNNQDIFIWCQTGVGSTDLKTDFSIPFVDASTYDSFSDTHNSISETLVTESNLSYIIHNEIPKPIPVSKKVDWALTLSSGFYINYVLLNNGFNENADIIHLDVSRPSLHVREYTIKNWDGYNFYEWLDHVYKKFPLLELFNGKDRLHSHDHAAQRCWNHVESTFGNKWIEHWKKYQQCNHYFYNCNLTDHTKFAKILETSSPKNKNSVIWWNGGLKRLPANLFKSNDQSFQMVKKFLRCLSLNNPEMIVYGSDHCNTEFNGITALEAQEKLNDTNSRTKLWKIL